jgi:hypothetical protein
MWLALTDLFRARWTDAIHEEWIRSLLEDRPDLSRDRLARTRDLMNANVRGCLVTGYEDLIEALALPDPDDRHVLAAVIQARADVIVTKNLRDFPAEVLGCCGMEAQHPDAFIAHLIDLAPGCIHQAAKQQRATLKNPPMSAEEFLDTLERQELSETVARLRTVIHLL